MNKNQKRFITRPFIIIMVTLIAVMGGYVFYQHHQSTKTQNDMVACQPAAGSPSCCINTPIQGSIFITVPAATSKEAIQQLIKPIKGTISFDGVAGDYEITVPTGSEKKAIKYLQKLPIIQNAEQSTGACASSTND